jgi:hypothetical protein
LYTYPYSPTLAANLLTSAGWVISNGLRMKSGQPFVITYTTTTRTDRMAAAAVLKQNLAPVGISVTLSFLDSMSFFGANGPLQRRTFDMATYTWNTADIPGCSLYMSNNIPSNANGWTGSNYSGYSDGVYDALCESAIETLTQSQSLALYQRTVVSLTANLPVITLYHGGNSILVNRVISSPPTPPHDDTSAVETSVLGTIWAWDTTTIAIVPPSVNTIITGAGGLITTTFPIGAFSETVVITQVPQLPVETGSNLNGIGFFFDLTAASQATGQPVQPQQTYTISLSYTDAEAQAAAVDERTLALYWWNGSQWVKEATSAANTSANTVTATPNHLSLFAVLGETHRIFMPAVAR